MKFNLNKINLKNINLHKNTLTNTILFNGWAIHEYSSLINYDINIEPEYLTILHIMTLVWQYVGLFIIAHDLHHDRKPSKYDSTLGRLSLLLYGGFMLEDFSEKHREHHVFPGTDQDPDFYDGNAVVWYLNFMKRYINLKQIFIQLGFYFIYKNLGITNENMILFWALPSLLASIQLFFYGTYLPHGKDGEIKDTNLPRWLQTLTSYNFGYHVKHHASPETKWQDLD